MEADAAASPLRILRTDMQHYSSVLLGDHPSAGRRDEYPCHWDHNGIPKAQDNEELPYFPERDGPLPCLGIFLKYGIGVIELL